MTELHWSVWINALDGSTLTLSGAGRSPVEALAQLIAVVESLSSTHAAALEDLRAIRAKGWGMDG